MMTVWVVTDPSTGEPLAVCSTLSKAEKFVVFDAAESGDCIEDFGIFEFRVDFDYVMEASSE